MSGIKTRQTLIFKIKNSSHSDYYWEVFCSSYKGYIYAIIRNMGASHHDCEELVQDVLIKAWKSLPEFEYDPEKGKFRWWLTRIVKNTVYDYMDKEKRRRERLKGVQIQHRSLLSEPEIDKIAKEEWETFVVKKAWENIKGSFKPEILKIFAELSNGESIPVIAKAYNLEENTIHVYKKRVQKRLYREVAKIEYELNC